MPKKFGYKPMNFSVSQTVLKIFSTEKKFKEFLRENAEAKKEKFRFFKTTNEKLFKLAKKANKDF